MVVDPKYWWALAEDCWEVKGALEERAETSRACRQAYMDKCHGAVERQLKAILAQQGRLEDADAHHNLVRLMMRCGLWERLPLANQVHLRGLANIHNLACYYDRSGMDRGWDTELGFATMKRTFEGLYEALAKLKEEGHGE